MIRNGIVEAFGFRCHGDDGIGGFNPSADDMECLNDDQAFLAHKLWVAPWADAIWTEPDLGDGHFNPTNRSYRYVCLNRPRFLEVVRTQQSKTETDCERSGEQQRFVTTGGLRKPIFEGAALISLAVRSVSRGSKAEPARKRLNPVHRAEAPARSPAPEGYKATIRPAPKRGPRPRYQWAMVHELLDELISSKSGNITRAEATKAILDWCAMQWGGEDGPGEPSEAMVRKHVAAHSGAPWAVIRTGISTPGRSRRPTALTVRQLSVIRALRLEASSANKWTFSIREFNELCDRSGVIDQTAPPSSQRRLKSELKRQLTNKALIAENGQTIRLLSLS